VKASNLMSMFWTRLLLVLISGVLCWAQEELPEQVFRTGTNVVQVPVTLKTQGGMYANGLTQKDFRLYDNDKIQRVDLDVEYTPISMVVAIQRNNRTEAVLPHVKKIGPMLEALVLGEQGEGALVAFDHRIDVVQDWTNNGQRFTQALEKLRPGSSSSRVIDAVMEGVRMLRRRPDDRRRILLLISETRDRSSEGRMRDTLLEAEFAGITIYSININRALAAFTTPAAPPPPDRFPAAARSMPGVAPQTPTEVGRLRGDQSMDFKPIVREIFTQVEALFVPNHAEVFTGYTGGREYSFSGLKGLETAMLDFGEELHSQYMLSYTPNNLDEAGYHDIRVEVNRPGLDVRARPGYWMAYQPANRP